MNVRYPGPHDAVEFAIESGSTLTIERCDRDQIVTVPDALGCQLIDQGWEPADAEALATYSGAQDVNPVDDPIIDETPADSDNP